MQPRVFGFVDHTHPAAAKLFNNSIMRDGLADHEFRAMVGGTKGQVNELAEEGEVEVRSTHPSTSSGQADCKRRRGGASSVLIAPQRCASPPFVRDPDFLLAQ